jgi:hypothetical protein
MPRSKTRPGKRFTATLDEGECFTILRALKHAQEWAMKTASPGDRATAAAEAADYSLLHEKLATELIAQGLGQPLQVRQK